MQDPTITPEQKKRIWMTSSLRKRAVAREAEEQEVAEAETAAINEAAADEAVAEYGTFDKVGSAVEESISQETDSLGGYASRQPLGPPSGKPILKMGVGEFVKKGFEGLSLSSSIASHRKASKEKEKEAKKRKLEEHAYRSLGFGSVR
jgi:hypothetical protein